MTTITRRTIVTGLATGVFALIVGVGSEASSSTIAPDASPRPALTSRISPRWPGPCPAIDDEPMCELLRWPDNSGTGGVSHPTVAVLAAEREAASGAVDGVTVGCSTVAWHVVVACME
jgi:hypothetical protein